MPWHIEKRDNRFCVIKDADGENEGCHDTRAEAQRQMAALYANEPEANSTMYLLDEYVATSPGEPYRLFKFGKIAKDGKVRDVTPELARMFKLPPYKPPIKRGSHAEDTPAGGHIVGLEVRDDGLYAIPEFTERGVRTIEEGEYRYHSPEVIWEDGVLVTNEGAINGPLIVGDALLHSPYLGEETALYSVEPSKENVMENTVNVPESLWDKFMAWVDRANEPPAPEEPEEPQIPEEYTAAMEERDQYRAELDALKAERQQAEQFAAIRAQFETDEFGAAYQGIVDEDGALDRLAGLDEEAREWVLGRFRALSAQIEEGAIERERGSDAEGPTDDPSSVLHAAVQQKMKDDDLTYSEAFTVLRQEQPELFELTYE